MKNDEMVEALYFSTQSRVLVPVSDGSAFFRTTPTPCQRKMIPKSLYEQWKKEVNDKTISGAEYNQRVESYGEVVG